MTGNAIPSSAATWNVVDPVNGRVLKKFCTEESAWEYWRALPHPDLAEVVEPQSLPPLGSAAAPGGAAVDRKPRP